MGSAEKRRGAGAGGSSSHVVRTTGATNSSSNTSTNSSSGPSATSNTSAPTTSSSSTTSPHRSNIISPPPRAALSGSSTSPTPPTDDPSSSNASGTSTPKPDPPQSSSSSTRTAEHDRTDRDRARERSRSTPKDKVDAASRTIARLERELSLMETEFTRELDRLSQNESETASFWQARHSALNQQFLRADTELRLLRAQAECREAERAELRAGWESLQTRAREREEEARGLRAQVRGLKEWVSTSTRADGQTSDEVFAEGMGRLGNGLQNWVIVNFRRAKLDLSKASKVTRDEVARLVPTYEALVHSAKVHLLQSIVSRLLVETVFDAYFIGLSAEQSQQFEQMEAMLAAFAGSSAPINQWRSHTFTLLNREEAHKTMQAETSSIIENLIARINAVLDGATDARATEARDTALRALVSSAVDLSRTLVTQRATFRALMPEVRPWQRVVFDAATMEDVGGGADDDDEATGGRDVCCVVFPGIVKHGDESGAQMHFTNVIARARVLCSSE